MYDFLIAEIAKRGAELTKYTDESYANHHQFRGRLMESQQTQQWLVACKLEDEKKAAEAKAAKPVKAKAKATPKASKKDASPKKSPVPSNVTALPKEPKKANG